MVKHEASAEQSSDPTHFFGGTPRKSRREWEDAQTDIAMWATGPVFLVGLVIIGTYTAAAGLVFMIVSFTALAVYFAFGRW